MRVEEVTDDAAVQAEPMEIDEVEETEQASLIIPITSSTKSKDLFIEIFPRKSLTFRHRHCSKS